MVSLPLARVSSAILVDEERRRWASTEQAVLIVPTDSLGLGADDFLVKERK